MIDLALLSRDREISIFRVRASGLATRMKMASEKVSRKMVLEIKYVNANNAVMHTENSKLLLDCNCRFGNWYFGKN